MCLNSSCSAKERRNRLRAEVANAASYLMSPVRAPAFGCFDLPREWSPNVLCLMAGVEVPATLMHLFR